MARLPSSVSLRSPPSPSSGRSEGSLHLSRLRERSLSAAKRVRELSAAFLCLTFLSLPALAVQPDEILKDPVLEARARSISAGLRCLVCQNQSIDDSDAPVAKDLRILIREQLQQNRSDTDVVDFIVARYGEFVLLKPRLKTDTLILWAAPFLLLAAGLAFAFRRKPIVTPDSLTTDEKAEVAAILRK
jgi:cytochrome c-type biogenesis protein CcmH